MKRYYVLCNAVGSVEVSAANEQDALTTALELNPSWRQYNRNRFYIWDITELEASHDGAH